MENKGKRQRSTACFAVDYVMCKACAGCLISTVGSFLALQAAYANKQSKRMCILVVNRQLASHFGSLAFCFLVCHSRTEVGHLLASDVPGNTINKKMILQW